ncbi:MAG: translation elongation factor Ts [Planctomycetes bacterium]|nr:translation elongation factor Ts [Planctomycetota bacterium]
MASAQDVKKLRDRTGAGMMDCKRALDECAGDIEAATDYLRKQNKAKAAKMSDREAREGAIAVHVSDDHKYGVILEVNSETDFVARNENFVSALATIAEAVCASRASSVEDFLKSSRIGEEGAQEYIENLARVMGENIGLRRFDVIEASEGELCHYVHAGAKMATLLEIAGLPADTVGKDMCMQIVATDPLALSRDGISEDILERERDVNRESMKAQLEGKPEQVQSKILDGKLEKFFEEKVLLEQPFVKDETKKVADVLKGGKIVKFFRYELGK